MPFTPKDRKTLDLFKEKMAAKVVEPERKRAGFPESMLALKVGDTLRSVINMSVFKVEDINSISVQVRGSSGITHIRAEHLKNYVIVDGKSGKLAEPTTEPTVASTLEVSGAEGAGVIAVLKQLTEDEQDDERAIERAKAAGHRDTYFKGVLGFLNAHLNTKWSTLSVNQRNFISGGIARVKELAGHGGKFDKRDARMVNIYAMAAKAHATKEKEEAAARERAASAERVKRETAAETERRAAAAKALDERTAAARAKAKAEADRAAARPKRRPKFAIVAR